jgi:hypothetical protein
VARNLYTSEKGHRTAGLGTDMRSPAGLFSAIEEDMMRETENKNLFRR